MLTESGVIVAYVPPYSAVRDFLTVGNSQEGVTVTGSYENFLDALRLLLAAMDNDENWYLVQNPDIAQAVEAGTIKSARQHFIEHGYFEGRPPFHIVVDEQWYLLQYPDVAESVRRGTVESAQRHFEVDGYREGRLPSALDDSGLPRKADRPMKPVPSLSLLEGSGSQLKADRPVRLVPPVNSGSRTVMIGRAPQRATGR